ncbi:MAG: hypothetical protein RL038_323, partial [Actinomycetota bacterium]
MSAEDPVIKFRDKYFRLAYSAAEINAGVQTEEFRRLIAHAQKNNAWWRNRIQNEFGSFRTQADLMASLTEIPVTTRSQIQTWGEQPWILPKNSKPGHFVRYRTSGSTGQPVVGLRFAPLNHTVENAITLMEWKWFQRKENFKILDLRVFGKFVDDAGMSPMFELAGYTGRRWERSTSDYSVSELFEYIEQIRPDYIYSNGITLRQLAQYGFEQDRTIPVSQFLSVADPIDLSTRELARDTFGAMIVDRYSSKEVGMIALQCPAADHLHVIETTKIVEILDESGQPVQADETGRVVITDLHSVAAPLIRYELGDFAQWETAPCPVGINWRAIKRVKGRIRDTVKDPNGEQRIVSFAGVVWLTWRKIRDQHVVRFDDRIVMFIELVEPLSPAETQTLTDSLHTIFYTDAPVMILRRNDLSRIPYIKRKDFTKRETNFPA